MSELKPCPFCGGKGCVIKTTFIGYNETFYHTVCLDCNLDTRKFLHRSEKDAAEAWNRRFNEIVYCKECKHCDIGTDEEGKPFIKCLNGRTYGGTTSNWFCADGEREE